MGTTELSKRSADTTAEICAGFELGDEAKQLLAERRLHLEAEPGAFLDELLALELHVDAVRFLAYALPKREAVWWACQCVRSVATDDDELAGLQAAEAWVRDPSEQNRRAAMEAAESLEFGSPDAWAAVGAFWTEGSLAPPDAPVLPPGDELTGHAVAGSVLLAAVQSEPEKAPEKQRGFVALGVDVANEANTWVAPGTGEGGGS
jgi:hypothetical protein